jgi:hypothetical protein
VAFIHPVTTTYFHMRPGPDTNAALNYPEPHSRAKSLGEHHIEPHPMATVPRKWQLPSRALETTVA